MFKEIDESYFWKRKFKKGRGNVLGNRRKLFLTEKVSQMASDRRAGSVWRFERGIK